jgi:hypothetical protein
VPRPVHFEIHASDPAASKAFYEQLFGWHFHRWEGAPYWLISTGDGNPMTGDPSSEPGIDGGLLERMGPARKRASRSTRSSSQSTCLTAAYLEKALAAGGSVAVPLSAVPGIGWLARQGPRWQHPGADAVESRGIVGLMRPAKRHPGSTLPSLYLRASTYRRLTPALLAPQ